MLPMRHHLRLAALRARFQIGEDGYLRDLHAELRSEPARGAAPEFPGWTPHLRKDSAFLLARGQKLEAWLNAILTEPATATDKRVVRALELSEAFLHEAFLVQELAPPSRAGSHPDEGGSSGRGSYLPAGVVEQPLNPRRAVTVGLLAAVLALLLSAAARRRALEGTHSWRSARWTHERRALLRQAGLLAGQPRLAVGCCLTGILPGLATTVANRPLALSGAAPAADSSVATDEGGGADTPARSPPLQAVQSTPTRPAASSADPELEAAFEAASARIAGLGLPQQTLLTAYSFYKQATEVTVGGRFDVQRALARRE